MTRLSLQSIESKFGLTIRLRVGQFCTLGSSSAADYCLRAAGIEPLHCRIGCRLNGGFIECFDDSVRIFVNGFSRSRARLVDGDALRVGVVDIKVEIPQPNAPVVNKFDIAFDDQESPSTQITPGFRSERQLDDFDDDLDSDDAFQDVQEWITQEDANEEEITPESRVEFEISPPEPVVEAAVEPVVEQTTDTTPPLSTPPVEGRTRPGKAIFEFDSVDPQDAPLSQDDIDVITESDSLEDLLKTPNVASVFGENPAKSIKQEEDGPGIGGGTDMNKFWRWSGEPGVAAFNEILDSRPGLNFYSAESGAQFVEKTEDEVRAAMKSKTGPNAFLMTMMEHSRLISLVHSKRWDERIGHPQAVTMFLTLSPAKIAAEFFESFEACVLIHENEVAVVRASRVL